MGQYVYGSESDLLGERTARPKRPVRGRAYLAGIERVGESIHWVVPYGTDRLVGRPPGRMESWLRNPTSRYLLSPLWRLPSLRRLLPPGRRRGLHIESPLCNGGFLSQPLVHSRGFWESKESPSSESRRNKKTEGRAWRGGEGALAVRLGPRGPARPAKIRAPWVTSPATLTFFDD